MNPAEPAELVALVAQSWPLGGVQAVRALGGGSINGAYRVQAQSGAYHLRVYRDPRRERAGRELSAIQVARQAGVPTPRPLQCTSGGFLISLSEGWAALFEVAPGAQVERGALNPGLASGMGAFLAGMHARLPAAVAFDVPTLGHATVEQTLERLECIEQAILRLPERTQVDEWALERTRQRLAHLRRAPLADYSPTFPRRFLHGDYHEGNLFFAGNEPISLIDWEQCRLAPRAWEVVRCLSLCLKLRPELSVPFLAAYRAGLPLSAEELLDGVRFYAQLQERNVWTYESVYLEGNPGPRQFITPPPYVPFQVSWAQSGLR